MAENIKEKKARIRNIVDTTENWKSANPILLSGEIGFEITSDKEIKIKIGDGITTWGLLEYITNTPKELQKKIDTLQSEIDNIVIASSEGGDVSAEVVQARVGLDGTNFTTLKARLDDMETMIDDAKSEAKKFATGEEVTFITRNNILASEYTEGKYYGYSNGAIANNETYGYFDYVFVEGNVEYYISHTQCHICFYDENKQFISGINNVTTSFNTFTTPSNAKYMIVSCMIGHRNYIYARKSDTITTNNKSTNKRLSGDITVGLENVEGLSDRLNDMEATIGDAKLETKKISSGEEVTFITRNNILASEYTEGKYYGYSNGAVSTNTNYGYFDYVFVEGGVEYYISHTQCHICFYDKNKQFISGINNATTSFNTFTTPSNAKYMIVSCMIGHRNYIYVRKSDTITTNSKSTNKRLSGDIAVGLGNIEGLSEELENTKNDELIEYALIQSSFTEGYFYNYATGVKQTNNTYGYYSYIEIKPDTTYYINLFGHICFYDSSKKYISGWENTSNTSNKAFTTPSNAKYMIVSCMIGHKEQIYISTEWGENITRVTSRNTNVLKKSVAIQKESLANILADILPADSTIVVDKNGNGNYTTVTEACRNAGEYNTIYIMPGVYENEEIWGTNTKTLYLVGADKHTCIIKNNTGQYAHPPMNIGSGLVQNLTIYAEKTDTSNDEKTYAIHAESHKMHNNSLRIDNCILKSDFGPALGMGMRGGCHVELSNTDFICTKADDALYFHDSDYDAYLGEHNISIRNCLIYSPKCWHAIYLQSQEKEGSMTYVEFLHNTFKCTKADVCAAVNWYSNTPTTDENDFKGLKNWRIKETSWGNSYADFNVV